ncbi:MAG: hydrogenase maturation nickel metallochaperone HypA [Propionibacteriaceae bacterium]|jgi:hydrogenase nickel incorporation protein HypA/HybF|nr:hydrogenase maturation nickel metallochaperone HypA [Propionibacteriaceae bacterium]
MHELSLCRSIYSIAARKSAGKTVAKIGLDVGELRQVVPQTLVYCWSIVVEGTALAGCELEVTRIPAAVDCRSCGGTTRLRDIPALRCGKCSSIDVEVVSGEEFMVRYLEVGS